MIEDFLNHLYVMIVWNKAMLSSIRFYEKHEHRNVK